MMQPQYHRLCEHVVLTTMDSRPIQAAPNTALVRHNYITTAQVQISGFFIGLEHIKCGYYT